METVQWPNSSQVISTAYEKRPDVDIGDLIVVFKSTNETGSKYKYNAVPLGTWEELKKATSIGIFINSYIKPHHTYTKL